MFTPGVLRLLLLGLEAALWHSRLLNVAVVLRGDSVMQSSLGVFICVKLHIDLDNKELSVSVINYGLLPFQSLSKLNATIPC